MNPEKATILMERLCALQHFSINNFVGDEAHQPPGTFNMSWVADPCGTPACIAGHIVDLFGDKELDKLPLVTFQQAADLIELDHKLMTTLFAPTLNLDAIKPHHAISAINAVLQGADNEADIWNLFIEEQKA